MLCKVISFVLLQSTFAPVVENQISNETSQTPPPELPLEMVLPVATGSTTVTGTAISELQSFPPINSPADEPSVTSTPVRKKDGETKIKDIGMFSVRTFSTFVKLFFVVVFLLLLLFFMLVFVCTCDIKKILDCNKITIISQSTEADRPEQIMLTQIRCQRMQLLI